MILILNAKDYQDKMFKRRIYNKTFSIDPHFSPYVYTTKKEIFELTTLIREMKIDSFREGDARKSLMSNTKKL